MLKFFYKNQQQKESQKLLQLLLKASHFTVVEILALIPVMNVTSIQITLGKV